MDNNAAYTLVESNKRLIEAMGMHWANKQAELNKLNPIPYGENDFSNLAHAPF